MDKFLEYNLFNVGIRPVLNPGISVSRIWSAVQTKIIKKLSSNLRVVLVQYHELAMLSQFASDLDKSISKQFSYGQKESY